MVGVREAPISPEFAEALSFVEAAYARRLRRVSRTAQHPIEVAGVLRAAGEPEWVVVAGLLHDVLEDTDVSADELAKRFGPEIAGVVEAVSQDETIRGYRERKADLRRRTVDGGREAANIALADKLAKLEGRTVRPKRKRIAHYTATVDEVEARYGPSPLAERVRRELERWKPS